MLVAIICVANYYLKGDNHGKSINYHVAGMSSSLMAQKQQIILSTRKDIILKQSVQTKGNV